MKLIPTGNRVVITGGAKGFGRAMAMVFAQHNWRIAVADLRYNEAAETCEALLQAGAEDAFACTCDVTQHDDIQSLYDQCMSRWQGVDVLINNAGIYCGGTFVELNESNWTPVLETNLMGTLRVTKAFVPMFTKQKSGRIVNIASLSAVLPMPGSTAYSASKGAVFAFSQGLRHELRPYKVGVSVAIPNVFKTDIFKDGDIPNKAVRNSMESSMHMSTITAEDVAQWVYEGIMNDEFLITSREDGEFGKYLSIMSEALDALTDAMAPLSKSMKNKVVVTRKKEPAL